MTSAGNTNGRSATTTDSAAASQCGACDVLFGSAVASNTPSAWAFVRHYSYCREASEATAGQIVSWLVSLCRRGQCAFVWPSTAQPQIENVPVESDPIGPIGCGHCFAVSCYQHIRALVPMLFGPGGPPHIAWSVWPVIVDAVNRVFFGWSRPDVITEGVKGFAPFVANEDAPPSVAMEGGICLAVTPSNHAAPDFVFGCSFGVRHVGIIAFY